MAFSVEARLALRGRLRETESALISEVAEAVTAGFREAGDDAKRTFATAFANAGFGRVGKAMRPSFFPRRGASLNPAMSFPARGGARTRGALEAISGGATIRARRGRFVAIPAPWLRRLRARRASSGQESQRTSPSRLPGNIRDDELRFVPMRGRRGGLLVVDRRRTPSRAREWVIGTHGRGRTRRVTVIAFILIPAVEFPRRVNLDAFLPQITAEIPRRIDHAIVRRMARSTNPLLDRVTA